MIYLNKADNKTKKYFVQRFDSPVVCCAFANDVIDLKKTLAERSPNQYIISISKFGEIITASKNDVVEFEEYLEYRANYIHKYEDISEDENSRLKFVYAKTGELLQHRDYFHHSSCLCKEDFDNKEAEVLKYYFNDEKLFLTLRK